MSVKRFFFPHGVAGWSLAFSLTALSTVRLLGAYHVRVGSSFIPEVSFGWILLLAAAVLLVVPPSRVPLSVSRFWAAAGAVAVLTWSLSAWDRHVLVPASPLVASVHSRSPGSPSERTVRLESLRLANRDALERQIGRRRRMQIETSGFLRVPRSGAYRFESSCDDRCAVRLDGKTVLDSASEATAETQLEEGLHRLEIHYVQGIGPASFVLTWDRPAWIELLPLEPFVASEPGAVTPAALSQRYLETLFALMTGMVAAFAASCLWIRLGERVRPVAAALWAESDASGNEAAAATPDPGASVFQPWSLAIFFSALAVRVGYLLLYDQPLLYGHQYNYFDNALRILEYPRPLAFILTSDAWHSWLAWTVAPLYHVFLAGIFALFGRSLISFRIVQFVMDAGVAVAVASLGRRLAGPRGVWAGAAYVVCWSAIDMTNWTMTENLHTFLLVVSLAVLTGEAARPSRRQAFWGGFLLGLSALTRAVSSAFVVLAGLWRMSLNGLSGMGLSKSTAAAAMLIAGGAAAILPWTARNVLVIGDPILIEDVSFFNLYNDNLFRDANGMRAAKRLLERQPSQAERRAVAVGLAYEGITEHPAALLDKIRLNFWHFIRPEGLHYLLTVELPRARWQHLAALFDDLLLFSTLPLFVVFLIGGRPSPTRRLIVMWTLYYLFLVVVVFHNEIRYRYVLVPFVFAGAAGGIEALARRPRVYRVWAGLGLGLVLSLAALYPYVAPAWRAASAALELRPAAKAIERGDLDEARRIVQKAAALDPTSARPWFRYAHWLALAGRPQDALRAYDRGTDLVPLNFVPLVTRPRLLEQAGRAEEHHAAVRAAHRASWSADPWLLLEIAWRELPPPRTDEILLGQDDYGAVKGFLHPRGGETAETDGEVSHERTPPGTYRWSRGTAWLRLIPTRKASSYLITLAMGSPFPSPQPSPEVSVRVNGSDENTTFRLTRDIRSYELEAHGAPGEAIVVRLDAPTWSRAGEPADQGVRVDRLSALPSGAASEPSGEP